MASHERSYLEQIAERLDRLREPEDDGDVEDVYSAPLSNALEAGLYPVVEAKNFLGRWSVDLLLLVRIRTFEISLLMTLTTG